MILFAFFNEQLQQQQQQQQQQQPHLFKIPPSIQRHKIDFLQGTLTDGEGSVRLTS
jgi:hypothetical protein